MKHADRPYRLAFPRRLPLLGTLLALLGALVLGGAWISGAGTETHAPVIADDGSKTDPDFG